MKGHKLTTRWTGANSSYAQGDCECGWSFPGWTQRMGVVRDSHRNHLGRVKLEKKVATTRKEAS